MTKTKETKILNGTYRKDRNGGIFAPDKFDNGSSFPMAPPRLNELGAKVWALACEELWRKGILYTMDLPQLEIYCFAMQSFWQAQDHIDKYGAVYEHTNRVGETALMQNPWVNVKMKDWEIINRLSAKFGMTPIDRNKLDAPEQPNEDDPLSKILKR